jgi:hypothetical protein
MAANDYLLELMWSSADSAVRIYAEGAASTSPTVRPAIPSIIATLTQVKS